MEVPRYISREPGGMPPPIYMDERSSPRGFNIPSRPSFPSAFSPSMSSIPMSIPSHSAHLNDVPPPLPPPRFVPVEGPSSIAAEEYRRRDNFEQAEDVPHYKQRFDKDEGYGSMESRSRSSVGSTKFGMHHEQFQFRSSAEAYDNSLLKKLDSRRTVDNRSPPRRSALSSSAREPPRPVDRFPMLQPLSLPTRIKQQQPVLDSPSRYMETPLHSAISPRSTPFGLPDYRVSNEPGEPERSPVMLSRRTNSGSMPDDATISTQGSYDMNGDDIDFPMEETSRLRDFHIDSALARPGDYHAVGQKRRASSPPGDEPPLHSMPSSSDLLRRRDGVSRASPTPRLSTIPQGSISSISSADRSGSYVSTLSSSLSLMASSMTSANSYGQGRRSPGGFSPGGASPTDTSACNSPYGTPISLTTSPRASTARAAPHHRTPSEQSRPLVMPRRLAEIPRVSPRIQGFFMCDCCPKKPKKFETAEELSAHEAEKQYECSFCGNRFKNKNEAERHQNSLHVRRHSWSCSALSGYDRAFHESTARPGEADTCGYCGEEFPRSGRAPGRSTTRYATEKDWDDRISHLQDIHKFRECNASKKFYRADHFRQHLKHSHAGTSGKWTNMLENACMMEEEPPIVPSRR